MSANWQSISQKFSHPELLNLIFKTAVFHGFPVALWRYPDKSSKQVAVDLSGGGVYGLSAVEEKTACFVMVPFSPGAAAMSIRADLSVTPSGIHMLDANGSTASGKKVFEETLLKFTSSRAHKKRRSTPEADSRTRRSTKKSDYCQWVQEALGAIHTGRFRKVVLSRTQMAELPVDFEPVAFFDPHAKPAPGSGPRRRCCYIAINVGLQLLHSPERGPSLTTYRLRHFNGKKKKLKNKA